MFVDHRELGGDKNKLILVSIMNDGDNSNYYD